MRSRLRHAACLALVLTATGCLRRVEVIRPLRSDECPPQPPSRKRIIVQPDSAHPRRISGRVQVVDFDDQLRPSNAGIVALVGLPDRFPVREDGTFSADSLPVGEHAIRFLRIGYETMGATVRLDARVGAIVEVDLEPMMLDGCPGFLGVSERHWRWKWPWR
jgi:hypothetical protein